jgi:hypothetical protein
MPSAVDHGNLIVIVASPELPCLRKTRLSVHAMAWLWGLMVRTGVIAVIDGCHG